MKYKVHGVSQSAVASCIDCTQACVSRASRGAHSKAYDDASLKFITDLIKDHHKSPIESRWDQARIESQQQDIKKLKAKLHQPKGFWHRLFGGK